jgi:hypothetical protein
MAEGKAPAGKVVGAAKIERQANSERSEKAAARHRMEDGEDFAKGPLQPWSQVDF